MHKERAAVRRAERSRELWATINICSANAKPGGGELGVRGQMPSLGFSATPQLQIPKPVFATDEMARFMAGVVSDEEIPEDLQESLIVHIVRPDGSKSDEPAGWAKSLLD